MNKTIVIVLVLILIGGGYYLLTNNSSGGTQTPTTATPAAQTPSASSSTENTEVSVSIKNFLFNPSTLSVKTGTKVTWTNNDAIAHTITSDSGSLLNSGAIAPGQSFSFTFTAPGSVSYHCAIHPMMKGSITVEN